MVLWVQINREKTWLDTSQWAATVGNGTTTALAADSQELVNTIYNKAIELGGTDEGPQGERMEGFYAAYFRDLDGNKLNIYCHQAADP